MKVRYLPAVSAALLTLLFAFAGSSGVVAAEAATKEAPGTVASVWVIWPKEGKESEFEAAIKAHAAWRKTAGEGFNWSIYQPVVGSDLGFYLIRSGEHHWKDFDAQAAWSEQSKADQKYQEQAGAYTARAEHYFAETDAEHSHWIDSKDYKYFGVTAFYLKSGMRGDRMDALNKIQKAVVDAKWPYPYEISNGIGGKEPMFVVTPMKSYADMADPDPSLMKVLAKSLGSDAQAAATMKRFGGTIDHTNYTIYAYRPDLSTPK